MKKIVLLSICSMYLFSNCNTPTSETTVKSSETTTEQKNEIQTVSEPTEIKTNKPVQKVNKTNEYSGIFYGDIEGTITFNEDKTVKGNFFDVNSSQVYKLRGTNLVDGEIKGTMLVGFDEYYGTLRKKLTNNYIIWSGYLQDGHNLDENGELISGGEYFEVRRPR